MAHKTVSMKTLARFFAVGSVISLGISLTGPGGEFMWGFLKPLSALLFGAFFISNLLVREYARYDEEHEYRMNLARERRGEAPVEDNSDRMPDFAPGPPANVPAPGKGKLSGPSKKREAASLPDH